MSERARHQVRIVRALVQTAVASGGEHRLPQVAAAVAYALLITLAPVILAYMLLQQALERVLEVSGPDLLDGSGPLSALELSGATSTGPEWLSVAGPWLAGAITLFGATVVFTQYVNAIALIWGVPQERSPVRVWLRRRLLGLVLLVASALLLAAASVAGSLLSALAARVELLFDRAGLDAIPIELFLNARFVLGFVGVFVLFTVSLMTIPLERPRFQDIWPGVFVTSAAYVLGDIVLGAYLRSSDRFTVFGSFGALIGALVWVYYSVLIVLYGAELTREIDRMRTARRRTAVTSDPT